MCVYLSACVCVGGGVVVCVWVGVRAGGRVSRWVHACVCSLYIPSILKLQIQEGYQKNGNEPLHPLMWFLNLEKTCSGHNRQK